MAAPTSRLEDHPDLAAMKARYERAGTAPMAQIAEGLAFLAGLYLAISPWVVGFTGATHLTVSNLVVGIAFAVLALAFGSAYERTHTLAWTAPLLGIWMIVSMWVVNGAPSGVTKVLASNIAVGAVATACGLAMLGVAMARPRRRRRG